MPTDRKSLNRAFWDLGFRKAKEICFESRFIGTSCYFGQVIFSKTDQQNTVCRGDTNAHKDVFIRDLQNNGTTQISVASDDEAHDLPPQGNANLEGIGFLDENTGPERPRVNGCRTTPTSTSRRPA